jgi:hypothetical protein
VKVQRRALILSAAIGLYYAVLGLVVFSPEAVYSGDIGVQYVQARSILDNRFRSLEITYPGAFLDPDRKFFPIRPPFVFTSGGVTQSIFAPTSALLQATGVSAFGLRGMILISVIAGWATLYSAARLTPAHLQTPLLVTLGFASPLWFYAISGWHHAAGMALGTMGLMFAFGREGAVAPFLSGLALGAGAALRDEVILLAPGAALAAWLQRRRASPLLLIGGGALVGLGMAAAIDVWWFERPIAAHLRHAVHLLQSALQTTDAANMDVPVLHPMTLRERHQTVVQYWLFGYGNDRIITAYVVGLGVALLVRVRFRSSVGIFVWLAAVVGLAVQDFWELMTAPKWLAGLYRVAPYLVFAVLPPPVHSHDDRATTGDRIHRIALVTLFAYLILAFAGVDTTGGKGLGPRLLLPLLPVLAVAAVIRIQAYVRGASALDRWSGRTGALLVAMTLIMHVHGTTFAYYGRNRDDSAVIRAVAASRERIVVADDVFTAQLLFPLYYRKIIFLADSPPAVSALASMLTAGRLSGALLVSRKHDVSIVLPGLRMASEETVGRMSITQWVR